jgi:DNA-binding NtrC family response regulator
MKTHNILLIDDELKVLSSLSRLLMEESDYEIKTAQSGNEGLEIIKKSEIISVIVVDYRMPGMNGIEFLSQAKVISPLSKRIMLAGTNEIELAVNAINSGSVFRLLLKPCDSTNFLAAIKDAVKQNELLNSEKELLTKTLNGSIKV